MRTISVDTETAWSGRFKGGTAKPMVRASIQKLDQKFITYHLKPADGRLADRRRGRGKFASAIFGQADHRPVELRNLRSVKWNRSIDQDLATCTLTLWNQRILRMGDVPTYDPSEYEIPGWFTYNRGETGNPWGYEANRWRHRLVPDRIIRTFEGYGFDPDVAPEKDPNLYPSGVWRIDDVEYTADGIITVTCRDIGSVLADQILFPPIVPFHEYPLQFATMTDGINGRPPKVRRDRQIVMHNWFHPTFDTDSNEAYIGSGLTDGGQPMVSNNGAVRGHHGSHAFDGDNSSYWLSVGNLPNKSSAYEYVQGTFGSRDVYGVRIKTWGGPYRVYISVFAAGEWSGRQKIPYRHEDLDATLNNNADIPFLRTATVPKNESVDIVLPKVILGATKIRVTLSDLYNSGVGYYRYRAGIKNIEVSRDVDVVQPGEEYIDGNYKDYTDIVRWLCAWGGFYWPKSGHRYNKIKATDDTTVTINPATDFDLFPDARGGNVWGSLQNSGTYGVVDHGIEIWDKKPILDGIKYVKDILGYNFYIDETGGIIFRRPNIYEKNNYVYSLSGGPHTGTTNTSVLIDEETTLLAMTARISNANIRERVFVANSNGRYGAVVHGVVPFKSHLRRVAGWCVDTETEIFTARGWLQWDQVKTGDRTLSLTEEGNAVWQDISDVAIFDAEPRKMLNFSSNNFSALTTPDHRWLVERFNTQAGTWIRRWATSETLTAMDRVARSAPCVNLPQMSTWSDDVVELVAWVYTEGCIKFSKHSARGAVQVYQDDRANPAHTDRIRCLLRRMFGDSVTESVRRGSSVAWSLGVKNSETVLPHIGAEKAPTMEFLTSLTQRQLQLFIDVSVFADGSQRSDGSRFFYQSVGPRLDSFLAACAMAGQTASYKITEPEKYQNNHTKKTKAAVTLYRSERHVSFSNGRAKAQEVDYDDKVWCPSIPEHHTWLARRHGSIYFTGNTDENFETDKECRVMAKAIALRQGITFRENTVTIPGNPAIQIDDQIRIRERMTGEEFRHYVKGISSDLDLATGKWTYTVTTNWLGDDPANKDRWWFDINELKGSEKKYLGLL